MDLSIQTEEFLSRFDNLRSLVLVSFAPTPIPKGVTIKVRSLSVVEYIGPCQLWRTLSCFSAVKRLLIHYPQSRYLKDAGWEPGILDRLQVSELVLLNSLACSPVLHGLLHDQAKVPLRALTLDINPEWLQINRTNHSIPSALEQLSQCLVDVCFTVSGSEFHHGMS